MDIRALVIKHIPYRFPKYTVTVGIFFQAYNIYRFQWSVYVLTLDRFYSQFLASKFSLTFIELLNTKVFTC